FRRRGDRLELRPALPPDWDGCTVRYVHRGAQHETPYVITLARPGDPSDGDPSHGGPTDGSASDGERGVAWVEVDGERLAEGALVLKDDGEEHQVLVRLGSAHATAWNSAQMVVGSE
ncbi:MAG TPA: hypothetical protein VFX49_22215, partial [Chloroflexota bacterium]|nr:hypothetical protein [Chloroflexota bacterium]